MRKRSIKKEGVCGVGWNEDEGWFVMNENDEYSISGISEEEAMSVVEYVKKRDGIDY